MDLAFRTAVACNQLTRYGGGVANIELADVLDALADINDDLCNDRNPELICEQIDRSKALLDILALKVNKGGE